MQLVMGLPVALLTDDVLVGALGSGCWEEGRGDPPAFPELGTITGCSSTELTTLFLPVDELRDISSG